MNQLIDKAVPTMSSREVAELVGSNHSDVKRSAERLSEAGVLTQPLAESNFEHRGNTYTEYLFNKRDSLVLVARLSPEFTAAVVDRWQQLEQEKALGFNPNDEIAVLEHLIETKKKVAIMAPKAEVFDRIVERTNLLNATQVGQAVGMSAIKLNQTLTELDVYNRNIKRSKAFQQWFVDGGYGEMKQTEQGYPQALFTTAGQAWVVQKFTSEGII
ncbi:DNA-binding protein [Pantoea phage PdC23]|uniref:DNA-binding protein n=1 Tax=Pantoea phage PdC23 TaxID=2894356 RepID=A0AAE8YHJ3_9CAUD|nr:DNA-binding protein [Pantoea phage PdC23]UGC97773.1 DNA-binding protein [Pantoea phage PdC23]